MEITLSLVFSCFIFSWAIWLLGFLLRSSTPRRANLPPGPKPKPLIGNMLDIPVREGHFEYAKWSKTYSSGVVFVSALGNDMLIINKRRDAEELLSKRAALNSDRPVIPVLKLMGWCPDLVALQHHNSEWRLHRKIMQQNFNASASKQYHPTISKKVHRMLRGLLDDPENFMYYNKLMNISIPLETMYGYEVDSIHNEFVEAAEASANTAASVIAPGGSLINIIPALGYIPHWFPGASSHKKIHLIKRLTRIMQKIPLDHATKQFIEGTAAESFVGKFLQKKATVGASKEEEQAVYNIAFTVYSGAAETTIVVLDSFFYQMAINPDIARKAQEEIDRVVGTERLPTLEDRPALPYIEAIYRELLRWMPSLPLGLPHCSVADDHYNGFFIPKGTALLPNIWAMAHDEEVYPEPFAFKPERFFDENGELNDDKDPVAYGFGRRICAGKNLASSVVWLTVAATLACFDITKAKDENGSDIEIRGDYENFGMIQHKAPFKCSIVPRSELHASLINGSEGL